MSEKIYQFIARSESDPNGKNGGLGYNTYEEAQNHCDVMNSLIPSYDNDVTEWNKQFWKTKPLEWKVYEQKD
jgi:hypothetical protein